MSEAEGTPDAGSESSAPIDVAPVASEKTYTQKYVQQLRDEAARYRTEKNSAVDAAKEAVSNEWQSKYDSLQADLGDSWVYAQKLHSTIEAIHPESKALDFAAILQGSDPDSISASAEKAKGLFGIATPPKATDPTQGSSSHAPLNGHPLLEKLQAIVGPPRS